MLPERSIYEKSQPEDNTYEAQQLLPAHESRRRKQREASQRTAVRRRFFYISFALVNICIGLAIGYLVVRYSRFSVTSWGINPLSPIPPEVFTARHNVAFSPDRRYMGPGKEVNKHWDELTDSSDSVYLPDPDRYGLHDAGIRAPILALHNLNNFYVLNTLHQLHCANVVRKRYNMLVYEPGITPLAKNPIDEDWIEHVEHCIEYLRYSITCADYMVLETDSPPGSPEEFYAGGLAWGVVHSCINWNRLMQWQRTQLELYNRTWNITAS